MPVWSRASRLVVLVAVWALVWAGCEEDPGHPLGPSDAGNGGLVNGCPSLRQTLDPPDGGSDDTYASYASGFFETWCVRCHATTNTTAASRHGAPFGYNWNDEASVRAHLPLIRNAVGVRNFMPFNAPYPSCDERRRLVQWIDLGAR